MSHRRFPLRAPPAYPLARFQHPQDVYQQRAVPSPSFVDDSSMRAPLDEGVSRNVDYRNENRKNMRKSSSIEKKLRRFLVFFQDAEVESPHA